MEISRHPPLEFPNLGSFYKPGFSGLVKVKPRFRVRV